ncbi:MAG: glucoamylase family protein [Candidatus Eisenbacteria bacterium]
MRRILAALFLTLTLVAPAAAQTTEALLDTLQHTAFDFFWNEANPANGLIRDRYAPNSTFASIASVGFGLSGIPIGIDHGWVSRSAGAARVHRTLLTFYNGPQGTTSVGKIGNQGLFYHFLNINTATRFDTNVELSSIDSGLLFAGMLDARQYFDAPGDTTEIAIRAMADSIEQRANWNFMRNFNPGIMMGWKPSFGFLGYGQWIGYNEAMIMYLLALGTPSYAVPTNAWTQWTSGYHYDTLYGYSFLTCPPLFTHQYSHCWVDFRDIADAYMRTKGHDYFENSRRATLAQRNYCIANPLGAIGYSDSLWGLTAGDGPFGYTARGAPPAQNDNGTITPTAAISSIPFTPNESIGFIRYMWDHYRPQLWGPYGWRDGFNLSTGPWYATDVIGIDQGPILMMIENYRTGKPWQRMMSHPSIVRGLARAGFQPYVLDTPPPRTPRAVALGRVTPDPVTSRARVSFTLAEAARVQLDLVDLQGRTVRDLTAADYSAGEHSLELGRDGLPAGIYWLRLRTAGTAQHARFVVLP